MKKSAIVLAGGSSSRFGKDKGLVKLGGKPLLSVVIDAVRPFVEETIVVTSSPDRAAEYAKIVNKSVRFAVDELESEGPLIGSLTGLDNAKGKYALVLPFDTPFVIKEVILLLFDLCVGRSSAIPRWPNGQIEPLHAVYKVDAARWAAKAAVAEGRLDMRGMIEKLRCVRFVSTLVIAQLDPTLKSFFNVNTFSDLRKATVVMKQERAEG